MEFTSITKRVAAHFEVEDLDAIAAAPTVANVLPPKPELPEMQGETPADTSALRAPINHDAYVTVTTQAELDKWVARARDKGIVCVDTETTSLDPMTAGLCGVSLAVAPGEACYIPCGHRKGDGLSLDLSQAQDGGEKIIQMAEADVLARLKPLLEDDSILKVGQNLKYDALVFLQRGIRLDPIDDTMLMSYVLEGGLHGHGMDELSELHLSHTPIAFSEVTGKGKDKLTFDCVPVKEATKYSAEDADVTLRLYLLLKPQLREKSKRCVYETLERPLVMVLADMERAGVSVDPDLLRKLSNDFAKQQATLEKQIHKLAGGEFNVGSPKQLGEILFDRMKLEGGARPRPAPGPPTAMCWKMSRPRAIPSPKKCWNGGAWPSCAAPIPMRFPPTSMPRPAGCTPPTPWPPPRPGGWLPPIPICRTFRSAPRKVAASARPSLRPRATS